MKEVCTAGLLSPGEPECMTFDYESIKRKKNLSKNYPAGRLAKKIPCVIHNDLIFMPYLTLDLIVIFFLFQEKLLNYTLNLKWLWILHM